MASLSNFVRLCLKNIKRVRDLAELLACVRGDDFSTGKQGMLWSRTRVFSLYFLSFFLFHLLCG